MTEPPEQKVQSGKQAQKQQGKEKEKDGKEKGDPLRYSGDQQVPKLRRKLAAVVVVVARRNGPKRQTQP